MPRVLVDMIYLIIMAAVIAADQIVKSIVRANMVPGDSISVIGDFFKIEYVRNAGAAFGILSNKREVLIVVPLVVMIVALIVILRSNFTNKVVKYALVLVISGGLSNLYDRISMGSVTDMLSFSIFPPVFNIADIAVTCGCALLVIYVLFGEKIGRSSRANRSRSRRK